MNRPWAPKRIKNLVIEEAVQLGEPVPVVTLDATGPHAEAEQAEFLRRQGESCCRPGGKSGWPVTTASRSAAADGMTIQSGGMVSFVQNFYRLSYPEAVTRLLNGEQSVAYEPTKKSVQDG